MFAVSEVQTWEQGSLVPTLRKPILFFTSITFADIGSTYASCTSLLAPNCDSEGALWGLIFCTHYVLGYTDWEMKAQGTNQLEHSNMEREKSRSLSNPHLPANANITDYDFLFTLQKLLWVSVCFNSDVRLTLIR